MTEREEAFCYQRLECISKDFSPGISREEGKGSQGMKYESVGHSSLMCLRLPSK